MDHRVAERRYGAGVDFATTRASYDTVAADYDELLRDSLATMPLERALLGTFVERVGAGPICDVGCGPGRIAAYLASIGAAVSGIDLSPGMVDVARRQHPHIRFEVGSMTDLDVPDGSLGGVLAWYSTVHMPPELLPRVYAELRRVLAPGGHLVTAFKIGDDSVHLDRAYGHELSLEVHRHPMELVARLIDEAGLIVNTRVTREPEGSEKTPQGYVLAHRPDR